jgi:hypothetical protein
MLILPLCMIGLFLRFKAFADRDIRGDELFSVTNATGPLPPFWKKLSVGGLLSFPGHYLSLWPFGQIFGANKWGLTIPHMLAAIFGFYMLYLLCQKTLKTSLAYFITFAIYCFNQELIYNSLELRPYGVLSTLALTCFYFSGKIITEGQSLSMIKKFLIGILFILTTFYHAYGLLIIFFCLLFFLLNELSSKKPSQVWLGTYQFLLPFVFFALPLFLWYGTGNPNIKSYNIEQGVSTFQFIPNPLLNLLGFLKGIFGNLIGNKYLYFLLIGLFIPIFLPYNDRFKQIGFFLVLIVLPIQIIFLSNLWGNYWFIQRQFIWTAPLLALLLGWCWDSLFIKLKSTQSFDWVLLKKPFRSYLL